MSLLHCFILFLHATTESTLGLVTNAHVSWHFQSNMLVITELYQTPTVSLVGFKGCGMSRRKLLASRIKMKTREMFGCTRFRGNTRMSRPLVCHWVLSGSDCSKRALSFSGLNHSQLIKKGLAAQTPRASAEQTDKWKCLLLCCPSINLL